MTSTATTNRNIMPMMQGDCSNEHNNHSNNNNNCSDGAQTNSTCCYVESPSITTKTISNHHFQNHYNSPLPAKRSQQQQRQNPPIVEQQQQQHQHYKRSSGWLLFVCCFETKLSSTAVVSSVVIVLLLLSSFTMNNEIISSVLFLVQSSSSSSSSLSSSLYQYNIIATYDTDDDDDDENYSINNNVGNNDQHDNKKYTAQEKQQQQQQQQPILSSSLPLSFPIWDDPNGISIHTIIDFLHDLVIQPPQNDDDDNNNHNNNSNTSSFIATRLTTSSKDDDINFFDAYIDNHYDDDDSTSNQSSTTTSSKKRKPTTTTMIPTHMATNMMFYILEKDGTYTSSTLRNRTSIKVYNHRVKRVNRIYRDAVRSLQYIYTTKKNKNHPKIQSYLNRWKHLFQLFYPKTTNKNNSSSSSSSGSIPFFLYPDDYVGCGYNNYWTTTTTTSSTTSTTITNKRSVPMLTFAAKKINQCHYSFPIPTYKSILDSKQSINEWEIQMYNWTQMYLPLPQKIHQIVWRGGLTGPLYNYTSIRYRLPQYVHQLKQNNKRNISSLFNVGIHNIPDRHVNKTNLHSILSTTIGGIVHGIYPIEDFQKYIAILDIDGNSWSSRFGTLLCYNSVILKIEPMYVDYFYYPKITTTSSSSRIHIQPYIHYIPVRYDLSNLLEQVQYVVNPANIDTIQQIINNANKWCRTYHIHDYIVHDYLDIMESYVEYLFMNNPDWTMIWNKERNNIFRSNNSIYNMTLQ